MWCHNHLLCNNRVHGDVIMPIYCSMMMLVCYYCLEHSVAEQTQYIKTKQNSPILRWYVTIYHIWVYHLEMKVIHTTVGYKDWYIVFDKK